MVSVGDYNCDHLSTISFPERKWKWPHSDGEERLMSDDNFSIWVIQQKCRLQWNYWHDETWGIPLLPSPVSSTKAFVLINKSNISLSMRMPPYTRQSRCIIFILFILNGCDGTESANNLGHESVITNYSHLCGIYIWRWYGLYNDNRIASSPAIQLPVRAFVCPWGSYDDWHSVWIEDEAGRII